MVNSIHGLRVPKVLAKNITFNSELSLQTGVVLNHDTVAVFFFPLGPII
jgi:hypothetical protein